MNLRHSLSFFGGVSETVPFNRVLLFCHCLHLSKTHTQCDFKSLSSPEYQKLIPRITHSFTINYIFNTHLFQLGSPPTTPVTPARPGSPRPQFPRPGTPRPFSGIRPISSHLVIPPRIASPRNPRRVGSLRTKLLGKLGTQNALTLDDSDEYIPLQRNSEPIHYFNSNSNPNQRNSITLSIGEDSGDN